MRRALVIFFCAALLPSCKSDRVDLSYRFVEGTTTEYRMEATASARWDIAGIGSGSYRVTFDVTEEVMSADPDGATVSVLMTPTQVSEQGLPSPGPDERSFILRLGPNGEVLEVLEVDGVPAKALEPDQLAFIGTYRPPLAPDPVRLGDQWESSQEVQLGSVFQEIVTLGELDGLDRDEHGEKARLVYDGSGPLVWTTTLPQGAAELTGAAETETAATLDLDDGSLRQASSTTSGDFEVRVVPEGRLPISGTLHLDLELDLERVL
jgi:hypothetical protein